MFDLFDSLQQFLLITCNFRFGNSECDDYLDVCCSLPKDGQIPPYITSTTPSSGGSTPEPVGPTPTPSPTKPSYCGIRNNNGIDFHITGNTDNEAEYGEFPWMVAILQKNYNPDSKDTLAICGGSIIAPNVILTGAHCVFK